jgi:glycosyltransferase involved in cell wall biosynthesis
MALRILLVSDHYPPFIGGAHRQTQLLGRELHARSHIVAVATTWQAGLPVVQDDKGVPVHRLKQMRALLPGGEQDPAQRHQPPFPDPVTVWGLRRLINQFKPDLVHTYGWISYSTALAMLGKNIPLLLSSRDYAYTCPTRSLVYQDVQPCSGPAFTKCMSCAAQHYGRSKGWISTLGVFLGAPLLRHKVRAFHNISTYVQEVVERDFLGPHRAGRVRERVIPSFREDSADAPAPLSPELAPYVQQLPAEPFILFVGALRKVKGVEALLAAYTRLTNPPPLVLIGTREFDSPHMFPSGVHVLEKFPHPAVMAAWERALFGVFPSLWPEPLGSVVYEGMSKGRAVIGTTPGGHTDMIVHGQTGFLVPPGDVDALSIAMLQLITDPDLRAQMGQAARERAQLFTASVAVPAFEQYYRDLITTPQTYVPENNTVHRVHMNSLKD